ncbi:MAG: cyclic nucleotide-binding domain-containing protein [Deltaproteobacteria bacterium]|nr:cyclic nucleotide-binding domain-containing protein [Deltaproteobacteria bacterium]
MLSFLDHFSPEHRQRFEAAAEVLQLERGQYLLRRGEAGGDIYLLIDGKLEVVDSRSSPEVILAVFTTGVVVGEMAFVDSSPRSADVRAAVDTEVLQWSRQDLLALLDRDADLAAAFYQAIARIAAGRVRTLTDTAMAGGLDRGKPMSQAGLSRVREEARVVAEAAKEGLLDIETRLRQDPTNLRSQQQLVALLEQLQEDVDRLFIAHPEIDAGKEAARVLGRELHPYLVRSSLAERCIRRPQGLVGTPEILAHVLVNTPGGDGQIGELLDRWLLDGPTMVSIRSFRDPILELVESRLPSHRNRRVLLLNAGTGSLVAGLMQRVYRPPTVLTVVDQSRDGLAFLDASVATRDGVELVMLQENLAQFALGRRRHNYPQQDVVIIHGLLEYLPDRLVVSLLRTVARLAATGGSIIATALAPSPDRALLDRVLRWPTIRRSREALLRLFEGAWVTVTEEAQVTEPGLLMCGTPDPQATARSSYTPVFAPWTTPQ